MIKDLNKIQLNNLLMHYALRTRMYNVKVAFGIIKCKRMTLKWCKINKA